MTASAQHILIVFHDFSFGGTEVIALRLAGEWARAGRRVTILCGTPEGPLRAAVPRGVHVETLTPEIGRSLFSRLRLRRALRAAVARLRPDVLFLPGNFHVVLAGAVRSLPRRPAVIAKISNPLAPASGPLRALIGRAFRWAARDVDWFVAMSSGLAEDVRRITGTANVGVIHDPNATEAEGRAPRARRGDAGPLRLLAAGRLVRQKDFALAIRIAADLSRTRDIDLTIVGEGPDRAGLEALARRLGVADRVHLPGHVASIGPALNRADLLLVTSRYEGGPAVAVEALERGVPVVATDCSHFLHDILVDPDCGLIVPTRDPAQFAARLLAWRYDAGRKPFSPQAATQAFAVSQAVDSYLRLFDRLTVRPVAAAREGGRALSAHVASG